MGTEPPNPQLPDGIDEAEYRRTRGLMRASVLHVYGGRDVVIAGIDPWDAVDEAWASMAKNGFKCNGPFLPFAIRVARNKAVDALKRAEARRGYESLDAPLLESGEEADLTLHDVVEGSQAAETVYLEGLDEVAVAEKVALYEEAIYAKGVLTDFERHAFLAVRKERKSRAAVGRELPSPLSGQRVGQIVGEAFLKISGYVREKEGPATATVQHQGGGRSDELE
jgi:DNA-directed RNA polymerase specialized sigma24 family protein